MPISHGTFTSAGGLHRQTGEPPFGESLLELAAVRTRVLSVEQILERLSDRFGLLTGGGCAVQPRLVSA
jgi:hypothetical protein